MASKNKFEDIYEKKKNQLAAAKAAKEGVAPAPVIVASSALANFTRSTTITTSNSLSEKVCQLPYVFLKLWSVLQEFWNTSPSINIIFQSMKFLIHGNDLYLLVTHSNTVFSIGHTFEKAPVTPLTKQVSSLRSTPANTVSPQKSAKGEASPAYSPSPQGKFFLFCSFIFKCYLHLSSNFSIFPPHRISVSICTNQQYEFYLELFLS